MEVFEIIVNEQLYAVYPDEWEFGIHQVKTAGGNSRLLRMGTDLRWEELDTATLEPLIVTNDDILQLLGDQIQNVLPSLFPPVMLVSVG